MPSTSSLTDLASGFASHLAMHFPAETLPHQQVLALAEEAGEFTAAYRRWAGLARRPGTWAEMTAELADVVITAYVTACVLGIDLDAAITAKVAVIWSRPWRESPPDAAEVLTDDLRADVIAAIDKVLDHDDRLRSALSGPDEWSCRQCSAGFFGSPPDHGLCPSCTGPGS
jgi:NTP pyrophosphatase (non-canonical NTP hydrolase)